MYLATGARAVKMSSLTLLHSSLVTGIRMSHLEPRERLGECGEAVEVVNGAMLVHIGKVREFLRLAAQTPRNAKGG